HAERAIRANVLLGKRLVDLEPVVDPVGRWTPLRQLSRVFQEPGHLTHVSPAWSPRAPPPMRRAAAHAPAASCARCRAPACTRAGKSSGTSAASLPSSRGSTPRAGSPLLRNVS